MMNALDNLAKLLSELPGVGPKSAKRMAFSLVKTPLDFNAVLAEEISTIQSKIKKCSICGSFTETDPCPVCSDSFRDRSLLCIVENAQDVLTIQSLGIFNGLFHVLGGALDPLKGIGPEELSFDKLLNRIDEGSFSEIIIATNPTEEGDTTALYIRHLLKDRNIKLTKLATGLPIGGDLEYASQTMLKFSLSGRVEFK